MKEIRRHVIPLPPGEQVSALEWCAGQLCDVPAGRIYELDGTCRELGQPLDYRFDRSVSSKDGVYNVVFDCNGTEGLIFKNRELLRRIPRETHRPGDSDYSLAIFNLPDGRTAIAHCPGEYCQLEIEEIESGERLTERGGYSMSFFHGRLEVSDDGSYLLSEGWAWQPCAFVEVFDLRRVLEDRDFPYANFSLPRDFSDVNSAAFAGADRILLAGEREKGPGEMIGVCNLQTDVTDPLVFFEGRVGRMMPAGNYVVGFHDHPKLIELKSGQVVFRWEELNSGRDDLSSGSAKPPLLGLDRANLRFAVAGSSSITVIQLGE